MKLLTQLWNKLCSRLHQLEVIATLERNNYCAKHLEKRYKDGFGRRAKWQCETCERAERLERDIKEAARQREKELKLRNSRVALEAALEEARQWQKEP